MDKIRKQIIGKCLNIKKDYLKGMEWSEILLKNKQIKELLDLMT